MKNYATEESDLELLQKIDNALTGVVERQTRYERELVRRLNPATQRLLHNVEMDNAFEAFDNAGAFRSAPGASLRTQCEAVLNAQPKCRLFLRCAYKHLIKVDPAKLTEDEHSVIRAINQGSSPGSAMIPVGLGGIIINLMSLYGAWRTLGKVPLEKGNSRVAKITGTPSAYWIKSASGGASLTADATIAGSKDDVDAPTLACLINVSSELAEDIRYTAEGAILEAIVNGLNQGLDRACFVANGSDDTTDGLMTGIFEHGDVTIVDAAAGNVSIATLDYSDFTNTIAAVSAGALQRQCRWWANPLFIAPLLNLKDGNDRILRQPTRAGDDWMLCGFPVTWTAVAPSTNGDAAKIAAFGRGDAYTVAMRQEMQLRQSNEGSGFASFLSPLRAVMRAQCQMSDADSFAILKTAAS